MPSLAEMYGDFRNRVSKQHFGPGQSVIWSAINDPKLAAEKAADWLNQSYASAGAYDPYSEAVSEKAIESAIGLSGLMQTGAMPFAPSGAGTLGSIKASHGSPHSFEKFLMSKIGTGEGAQAYGHGMYFGEGFDSPVAKGYRTSTSKGFGIPSGEDTQAIANLIAARGDKGEEMARKAYANLGEDLEPKIQAAKKAIDENSHLYNVELRWPDAAREAADPLGPEHFLQWDRPLSEQMGRIKAALGDDALYNLGINADATDAYTGKLLNVGDFAQYLQNMYGAEGSKRLANAGIPGIRYLDQGSRGAGQGTHNYVVFDENIPNIVSRNGVSLSDLLRR